MRSYTLLLAFATGWACGMAPHPVSAQAQDFQKQFPWFAKEAKPPEYPEILVSREWLAQRLADGGAVPVDVRPRSRYQAGHLRGAIPFEAPADLSASREVRALLGRAGLQGGEALVLYGGDTDRLAIGQAFLALTGAGWHDVRVLAASYEAGPVSDLPIETAVGERPSGSPVSGPETERPFATTEELRGSFGQPGFEVLDLRGGWGEGYEAPAPFAAGHVSHALPLDVESFLPSTGWPAPEKVREALGALGSRSSDRVDLAATFLLYGEGPQDPRPGLGFLLLRMAGISARVSAPGFAGWAGDPRNPVVRLIDASELESMLMRDQKVDGQGMAPRLMDQLPQSFILLDLREDWDYDEEHVPGAYSLPEQRFSERFEALLRERWPHVDSRTTPLVFYCYGRPCTRSRNCATIAAQKGFVKLLWFREGMEGWAEIGGPVFQAPTGGAPTASRPRVRPGGRP